MYNAHRGIAGAPAPPNSRLVELLEQVRAEFEAQGGRANEYEHQRESSPFVLQTPARKDVTYRHMCCLLSSFNYPAVPSRFCHLHHRKHGIPQPRCCLYRL